MKGTEDIVDTFELPGSTSQVAHQPKPDAEVQAIPEEPKGRFAFFKSPRFYLVLLIG